MVSRADTHDLDKLKRWQQDLEATSVGAPPVFAIFLVSGEDRGAHDVFRAFRASFEEHGLGFAHLVIFGQHGLSETASRLQSKFGLESGSAPTLVIFSGDSEEPQIVSLPPGEASEGHHEARSGWQDALDQATSRMGEKIGREASLLETLREICVELGDLN